MMPEHVKILRRTQRRYDRATLRAELVGRERDEAVRECLRQGLSYRKIADACGLHFTRIQQIAQGNGQGFAGSNG